MKDDKLNFYQCVQLIDYLVKIAVVNTDPNDKDRVLVYRSAGDSNHPKGWYSESVFDAARELADDYSGQQFLLNTIQDRGFERPALGEL